MHITHVAIFFNETGPVPATDLMQGGSFTFVDCHVTRNFYPCFAHGYSPPTDNGPSNVDICEIYRSRYIYAPTENKG